jgi:hypothetical protein
MGSPTPNLMQPTTLVKLKPSTWFLLVLGAILVFMVIAIGRWGAAYVMELLGGAASKAGIKNAPSAPASPWAGDV